MKDNQGRDLGAVKRHHASKFDANLEGRKRSSLAYNELVKKFPLAEWVMFDGFLVLRCGSSKYIAVPASGKRNAARFNVINIKDLSDYVAFLTKKEVRPWLWQASQVE